MKHKAKKKHAVQHHKTKRSTQRNASLWDIQVRELPDKPQRRSSTTVPTARNGWNDEELYSDKRASGEFTAGELGEPDAELKPDAGNPGGVQSGRGPLNQEGEGERQNAQLAELESDADDETKG